MALQYIFDDTGRKTAVIVPIEEWERIREDSVTPEEAARMDGAWEEYREGNTVTLDQLRQKLLGGHDE